MKLVELWRRKSRRRHRQGRLYSAVEALTNPIFQQTALRLDCLRLAVAKRYTPALQRSSPSAQRVTRHGQEHVSPLRAITAPCTVSISLPL